MAISSGLRLSASVFSLACGRFTFRPAWRSKLVVITKNSTRNRSTSIKGMTVISTSNESPAREWNFMARSGGGVLAPRTVHDLDQADGFLLHAHHQLIHAAAE